MADINAVYIAGTILDIRETTGSLILLVEQIVQKRFRTIFPIVIPRSILDQVGEIKENKRVLITSGIIYSKKDEMRIRIRDSEQLQLLDENLVLNAAALSGTVKEVRAYNSRTELVMEQYVCSKYKTSFTVVVPDNTCDVKTGDRITVIDGVIYAKDTVVKIRVPRDHIFKEERIKKEDLFLGVEKAHEKFI